MSTVDKVGSDMEYLNLGQLYTAIRRKERKKFVENIIKNKKNINYQVPSTEFLKLHQPTLIDCTALHLAFDQDNIELFNLLLDYNADINIQNNKKITVLRRTVEEHFNRQELLKLRNHFNEYHQDFTVDEVNGFVIMQRAIEENTFKKYDNWQLWDDFDNKYIKSILSTCIKNKNFIKSPDEDGISYLHAACLTNNFEAVKFFMKNGVDVNEPSSFFYEFTPLHFAVKYSEFNILETLLSNSEINLFAKNSEMMSPIDMLVDQNLKIIEWLHAKKKFPYNYAILDFMKNEEKVNSLMEKLVDLDPSYLSSFHIACTMRNPLSITKTIIQHFVENNEHINDSSLLWPGYTALHFASYFNIETAKILLNNGADIEAKDANGITPLDILATRAKIDDIHFIISHKESWSKIVLSDGKTKLLDLISEMRGSNSFKIHNFMRTIDVNSYIPFDSPLWPGYTILHLAVTFSETEYKLNYLNHMFNTDRNNLNLEYDNCCHDQENNYLERIETCLDRQADITIKDARGWTPLNLAFRLRKMEAVHMMLQNYNKTVNPIDDDGLSHLHIACLSRDQILVEKLLSNGADVNSRIKSTFKWNYNYNTPTDVFDIVGSTPLHLSVSAEDDDLVKVLVNNGADVNAKDDEGMSPLHRSFIIQKVWENGNDLFKGPKSVDYVLRRGRRSGIPNYRKAMDNIHAISNELLLAENLKESIVDDFGLSHLHVAVFDKNDTGTFKLLNLGSDVNSTIKYTKKLDTNHPLYILSRYDGWTCLDVTREKYIPEIERIFLKRKFDFYTKRSDGSNYFFDKLQDRKNMSFFVMELEENEDFRKYLQDEFGWTILHVASKLNDVELTKYAIEIGVDVNLRTNEDSPIYPGCTALHILMMNCNKTQESVERQGEHEGVLKPLLDNGADVMITDVEGNTPLHRSDFIPGCMRNSYAKSVYTGQLLDLVEDFTSNPINHKGISLFHIACIRHNITAIKKFLEQGVDVNQPVEFFSNYLAGCTPLHLAAKYLRFDPADLDFQINTVKLLLESGADVHARDVYGDTPLHAAVECDPPRHDVIELIFKYGADMNAENIYGKTPLQCLLSSRHPGTRELSFFLKNGCRMNTFNVITRAGYIPLLYRYNKKFRDNDTLKLALDCPSINEVDHMGRTSIHNVASIPGYPNNDDTDVIGYLVDDLGCDINLKDSSGKTALHLAVQFRNHDAVDGLLMYEADINKFDSIGKTAFTYSLESESLCDLIDMGGHNHHLVIETLARYIYHLDRRGIYVNNINRIALLKAFNKFSISRNEIEESYNIIKDVSIGDTRFIVDDFLSETKAIVYYSKIEQKDRETIRNFFTHIVEEHRFHYWMFLCKLQYRKAVNRADLVDEAKDAINVIMGFPLPDLCFLVLEKFLSNADLKRLIAATS